MCLIVLFSTFKSNQSLNENFSLKCVNHSVIFQSIFFLVSVSWVWVSLSWSIMVQTPKKIHDSSPQLKFFTSFSRFCKFKINLASQAISFMKEIPSWRIADFLILAWINSICLFSSCCGQFYWKNWCFIKELGKKKIILERRDLWGKKNAAESSQGEPGRHRQYHCSGLLRKGGEGTLCRYFLWFQILQSYVLQ